MLENLHVKNFAIIDEIDVDFGPHLNILTGETGAGKSILIGSVNIVLGARVSPEMIGRYGDSALVEAVFHVESQSAREKIRDCGVEPEKGEIIISRQHNGKPQCEQNKRRDGAGKYDPGYFRISHRHSRTA